MRVPGWIIAATVIAGASAFLAGRLSSSAEPVETIDIAAAQADLETPKVLRVAMRAARRNYDVPFKTISLESSRTAKRPAILWLAGCGYAMRGRATPKFGAVFMVDEWGQPSGPRDQACQHHDAAELRSAFKNDLDFGIEAIRLLDWVDHDHILVVGSGEAAPVVAEAFNPAVTTKLLIADPCTVSWQHLDKQTPTHVIWSARSQGMEYNRSLGPNVGPGLSGDPEHALAQSMAGSFRSCDAQPRPNLPPSYISHQAAGPPIDTLSRPKVLWTAQEDIMKALWPNEPLWSGPD